MLPLYLVSRLLQINRLSTRAMMNLRAHSELDSLTRSAAVSPAPRLVAARALVAKSLVKVDVLISISIILLNGKSG